MFRFSCLWTILLPPLHLLLLTELIDTILLYNPLPNISDRDLIRRIFSVAHALPKSLSGTPPKAEFTFTALALRLFD
jgi:hypothetical protein